MSCGEQECATVEVERNALRISLAAVLARTHDCRLEALEDLTAALAESGARLHRALTVVEQYHHVTVRNDADQVIEVFRAFKEALMTEAERKADDLRPRDLRDVENTRLCILMARVQDALERAYQGEASPGPHGRIAKALALLRGER